MADSALKTKTTHSLFWSFIDKFGQQILNFVSMLVLMNIVTPDAHGLIASLAVFTAFSTILIDSGFGRSLLNRKEVSSTEYSSIFYFNIILAVFIYLLLFFLSPLIAHLFNAHALIPISRVIFLSLVFNAFGLIHYTILVKRADFRRIMKMNMLALLIADIVAITMALMGYGVWALVLQIVLFAFFRTILLWSYSSWKPIMEFSFSWLRSFFGFSYKLMLSSMISSTVNNIYPSLIAVFYPMNQVAFFNQAKKYQEIPFLTISNTFRSVAMLILSEINEETERLKRVVRKLIKSIAFLSFPIALMMILVAEPTFYLFFQEKWLASVPYFQVLTLAGMLLPFTLIFNELFIAKERSAFFLGLETIKGVLLILLIILLFPKGIMGLAVSWVVYIIVTLILSMLFSGKVIHYSLYEFVKDIFPYLLTAVISTAVSYFSTRKITNNLLFVLVNPALITLLYITLCKLFRLEMTKEIDKWFALRNKGRKRI